MKNQKDTAIGAHILSMVIGNLEELQTENLACSFLGISKRITVVTESMIPNSLKNSGNFERCAEYNIAMAHIPRKPSSVQLIRLVLPAFPIIALADKGFTNIIMPPALNHRPEIMIRICAT